jgi:hypothetical protein
MVSSCDVAKSGHNLSALQPESSSPVITADGKCPDAPADVRRLAEENSMESIEIIIDGTRMLGGQHTPTLLGESTDFLPCSMLFSLEHFEPRTDGTCLARYTRNQAGAV